MSVGNAAEPEQSIFADAPAGRQMQQQRGDDGHIKLKRHTLGMMADQMVKESTRKADVIIAPKVEGIRLFDWKMIETVVQAGEEAAKHSIPLIRYLFEKVIASNMHD